MSNVINKFVKIGTFGLVDDFTGTEAAGEAGQAAANVQAQAAMAGLEFSKEQRDFERRRLEIDRAQNTKRYNQQFDLSQERFDLNREDNAPRIVAGNRASSRQQALLGLSGQNKQQLAYDDIQESAGQRFLRERSQRALVRNSSAIGGLGGGNVRTALQEQATGFAMQDVDNQFNRLGAIAAQGQNASNASGQIGAQPTSTNASNFQTNIPGDSTNNIINALSNQGAAQASGILAPAQANAAFTNQLLQLGGAAAGAYDWNGNNN
jgi:hypothetical protein